MSDGPSYKSWERTVERAVAAEKEAETLRTALEQIDALPVDWTQGTDANFERLKDIARAALSGERT